MLSESNCGVIEKIKRKYSDLLFFQFLKRCLRNGPVTFYTSNAFKKYLHEARKLLNFISV